MLNFTARNLIAALMLGLGMLTTLNHAAAADMPEGIKVGAYQVEMPSQATVPTR